MTPFMVTPHDVGSEQSFLGSLLIDNASLDLLSRPLHPSMMFDAEHRRLYEHLLSQIMANRPADIMTVADAGFDLAYLGDLVEHTPTHKNISRYADIIRAKAQERALLAACADIQSLVYQGIPVEDKLNKAQAAIMALTDEVAVKAPRSIASVLGDVADEIIAQVDGKRVITPTGYADLDAKAMLFEPQNLIIVAGRPSMGKTAFAVNLLEKLTAQDKVGLMLSQEMSDTSLGKRLLAMKGRIPLDHILRASMNDDEYERMLYASGALSDQKLLIDEQGSLTLMDVRTKARAVKRQHGQLDLIVVDYLQLMVGQAENRQQEISEISRGLKGLAKELDCPVIALSQLSRKVEERGNKRPMMSDLRESGAIEQDADVIVFMYRDEYYNPDTPDKGIAEAIIAKQRNGAVGTVPLVFIGEYQAFESFAGSYTPAAPDRPRAGYDQ